MKTSKGELLVLLGLTEVEVDTAVEEDAAISNLENRHGNGRDVKDGDE